MSVKRQMARKIAKKLLESNERGQEILKGMKHNRRVDSQLVQQSHNDRRVIR